MAIAAIIGISLIILGLYTLLTASGFSLQDMSFVSVGPVTIGDISEENAIKLFVGAILLIIGSGVLLKGTGKRR